MTAAPADEATSTTEDATDSRAEMLDKSLRRTRYAQDQLIELLHVAQDLYGHLSDDVLAHLARELQLPPSLVYGVATFYHLFVFDPPGDHACTVCTGTACFVKGADDIVATLESLHGLLPGQTTPDGALTLSTARCLGSCSLAPVMVLDGAVLGHQTVEAAVEAVADALATERERA